MGKILLIVSSARKTTIPSLSFNLYCALRAKHEVVVVVLNSSDEDSYRFENELRLENTEKYSLFYKILVYFKKVRAVKRLKKRWAFDLTIGTDHSSIFVDFFSGRASSRVGIFHRQIWRPKQEPIFSKKFLIISIGSLFIFPWLSRLIAVSRTVERSLQQCYFGLLNRKIKLAYNIINESGIVDKAREKLCEKEQKLFEKNVIVCVGRLDRNKNPIRLVKAFAMLPAKLKDSTTLVFIGSTQDKACFKEVESLVCNQGIANSVFFLGEKENPYPFIKQAKVLVSSSISEGLPTVLIEALILNTPIISTNSSEGVWEILSCDSDYDPILSSVFEADKGVITSNMSAHEDCSANNEIDVINLSLAMKNLLECENACEEMRERYAQFRERLSHKEIVRVITQDH